jgi:hypothetical protein
LELDRHQLLVCADDVNLLVGNINNMKRKTETLSNTNKEVLDVNTEKTKYMFMFWHQNAGQNHNIKVDNK